MNQNIGKLRARFVKRDSLNLSVLKYTKNLEFRQGKIEQMKHRESVYPISRTSCPVVRGCSFGTNACVRGAVVCFKSLLRRLTPPLTSHKLTLLLTQAASTSTFVAAFLCLHASRLGRWVPLRAFFLVRAVFSCGAPGLLYADLPATNPVGLCQRCRCVSRLGTLPDNTSALTP